MQRIRDWLFSQDLRAAANVKRESRHVFERLLN
jgi:hypothetical protein